MGLFTDLTRAWTWFKTNVIDHIKSGDKIAIVITETVKTLLTNPVTGFLLNIADAVTGSQIPTVIANTVISVIPKVLAAELAIQGLPDNPTPEQILAFEQSVLQAFSVSSNNSKLYTILSAQIYGIIQASVLNGKTNFADLVLDVEQAYADYKADLLIINAPVGTMLPNGNIVVETPEQAQQDIANGN